MRVARGRHVCAEARPTGDRQRRSALAGRAVERRPPALPPALDGAAAYAAWLALAAVHEMAELRRAGASSRIDVIAQRAPTVRDRIVQHLAHGGDELLGARPRHLVGCRRRPD